jgi:hypothetical protein
MDRIGPSQPTEEDDEMNIKYSPLGIIKKWAFITGMVMISATVQADRLSSALYGDELDRCTTEMRSELNLTGVTRLQHTLTDIDKVGVWYVFDIQTTAYDEMDTVMVTVAAHCKAHRWTGETVVDVTEQPAAGEPGIDGPARVVSAD